MMEDSHFNSSYFWSPVPTMQGQIENAMFLNKVKEQQEKNAAFSSSSASHYQTALLTIPTPGAKTDGGGQAAGVAHLHPPHSTQNITVLPVPSTGIMTAAGLVITTPQGTLVSPTSSQSFVSGHPATTMIVSALHSPDKKDGDGMSHVVVMPAPSKRGRKRKTTISRISGQGNETLVLAHLTAGGQVASLQHHGRDPYDLSNEDDDHGPKDSTKTYRCRMCAATFFSKSDMQIHSKSHTEAKPHKCPHCAKSFANSSYLAQHIRIHSGAKPYTCSYCQKSFRQLSHLQQHSRNHTESKPHKCPHCTKSFANSSYLAQHIRIHTGVKPYSCSYCQKCFRQLSHLQQHNRIHTGDRPYKCSHPGCEKSFTQLSNLQSHRRQHNKDKPYKCTNCNKGYIDSASLEVHMSTHTVKHARIYSCSLCNRTYTSVRQMSISEEYFYIKNYESPHWQHTPGSYFTPCSHVSTVSPLPILPSSQETYLVKHMEKHNPDQLTAPAVVAAQAAQQNQNQGQAGAQSRVESSDGGSSRSAGAGSGRLGGGQQGQSQSNYPQSENICPFDLHQYKTVSASDLQYKQVSVADITSHKDLCLTVSASSIQVEHLNS
ncbi:zinc finger protein 384b isoform X1 [Scophthalmus maximus]|uniref:zinc finger protein 384b isoform X1 n=1 Tax=Scophthalmus maximus TaxID=52904 RepID=UPI0015E0B2AC|nr:zinc finger protein 384b isoform X1 [Scophthalmus maximus]XP_035497631.1 zinc finger protein 384b isoform X1 [Scophthalmus maximus]XP_035497634.1 zinc finger protein 384b isoform X1 [Scophthalmus maximus]XP_035497642.1 zinc finger protein 384b isoform X1 [Scophthalmus maximus]